MLAGFYVKKGEILLLLFMAILVFSVYSNTLGSPFTFDDTNQINENKHIRLNQLNLDGIVKAGFKSPLAKRPVANISFAMNYYFHQYNVMGYHLFNILIHITTCMLIYFLFKTTLLLVHVERKAHYGSRIKTRPSNRQFVNNSSIIAFSAAIIWAVNPVHTQSVTYVVQRMNSMAGMFYILSFLLYVKGRITQRQLPYNTPPRLRWISALLWPAISCPCPMRSALCYVGSILAGIMAFGSKEIAYTLPVFIFLYEWYFFQEMDLNWFKRVVVRLSGILLIAAFIMRFLIIKVTQEDGNNLTEIILAGYKVTDPVVALKILTELRVVVYYISLLIAPHPSRLNIDYDFPFSHSLIVPLTTMLSVMAIAGLIFLLLYVVKKDKILSFSIIWFLGNLMIESSVIGLDIAFEHRTYLPSMMVSFIFVIMVYRHINTIWLKAFILGTILIVFSIWTYERNSVWSNEVTLWQDCADKSPNKARPHYNLAYALAEEGKISQAVEQYRNVIRIEPDHVKAHTNLGLALFNQGKDFEAIEHYKRAIKIDPDLPEAYNSMGNALFGQGKYKKAIESYKEALRIKPDYFQAHNNMGLTLYTLGRTDKAIEYFTKALRIKPYYPDAYNNLGAALVKKGMIDKAVVFFKEALRIDPGNHKARNNLNRCISFQRKRVD